MTHADGSILYLVMMMFIMMVMIWLWCQSVFMISSS